MGRALFAFCFLISGLASAQQQQSKRGSVVLEEGNPARVVFDADHEGEIQFFSVPVSADAAVSVVENTCDLPLAKVGRSHFEFQALTYFVVWTKHPDASKIGQAIKTSGTRRESTAYFGAANGDGDDGIPQPNPETIQIAGLTQLLENSETPGEIPKITIETNSTNPETKENQMIPYITYLGQSVRAIGADTYGIYGSRRLVALFNFPILFSPLGEATILIEPRSGSMDTCQVRVASKLGLNDLIMMLRPKVEPAARVLIWKANSAHARVKANQGFKDNFEFYLELTK